jgi:hypothetical protein
MVWRRPGDFREEVLACSTQYPFKLMVWGGIMRDYKTELVIFGNGETMNSQTYIEKIWIETKVIEQLDNKFGHCNWFLQQDNASCHTANNTIRYLNDRIKILENWPPHSPDLNLIELVWAWMKMKIEENRPSSEFELIEILKSVWDQLTFAHVNALIDSMPRRLMGVYNANGGHLFTNNDD